MRKYVLLSLLFTFELIFAVSIESSADDNVLLIDTDASCITASCHENMGKKKYTHSIGVDNGLCGKCHEILSAGEHRFKNIPPETGYLCAQCHSENASVPPGLQATPPKVMVDDKDATPHLPFAKGKCTACHDAHESNFQKYLKAEYPENIYQYYSSLAYALCFNTECHANLEQAFTTPRTLSLTGFRNGNRNLHFRHVNKIKGRTCKACHHQHVARNQMLITDSFKFGNRRLPIEFSKSFGGGTCQTTCHRPASYDRYEPVKNTLKTSPMPGKDATDEELSLSLKKDIEKQKKESGDKKQKERPGSEDEQKQ